MKVCSKCKTEKPLADFGKHSRNADGLRYQCKSCENSSARLNGTKEGVSLLRKQSQQKYRATEKCIQLRKAHDELYRFTEKRVAYKKDYDKKYIANRMKNDFLFKLACKVRKLINIGLKKQGFTKKSKSAEIVGCDYAYLQSYLEAMFQPEMSWDNFGEWHLDHIDPISNASDLEGFITRTHYTNLQPMWGKYNLIKNNMSPTEWALYIKKHNIDVSVRPNS